MSAISTEPTEDPLIPSRPDDEIILLPGWPGYRTQPGRSGLDYIDTQMEMGHMAGVFLRQLFTNTWRRSGIGPHPLVTLAVGVTLCIAVLGGAPACLGIVVLLLIGLIGAVRNRKDDNSLQDPEESNDAAEEDLAVNDDLDAEDSEK